MFFIALRMLLGDKAKYLGLILGIAFSTLLMAQQVSIFLGILSRASSQIEDIYEPNLWIMNNLVQYVDENRPMPDRELHRIRSISGVEWAVPFYKGTGLAKTKEGVLKALIILGVDDETLIGRPQKMVQGSWEDLKEPEAIILDAAGWEFIWPDTPFERNREIEINDRRFRIVGLCEASPTFQSFPIVFIRRSETSKLGSQKNILSFVLAKTKPGIAVKKVQQEISERTGLLALTKAEFKWKSIEYYLTRTGLVVGFGTTVLLGFLVGALVSGLTFYLFVMDNLKQFGALKAMGVTNQQLFKMVSAQASLVASLGFSVGIGLTALFFKAMSNLSSFRGFELYWQVVVGVFIAVLLIVILSSFSSIRRILDIDPAIVFRA